MALCSSFGRSCSCCCVQVASLADQFGRPTCRRTEVIHSLDRWRSGTPLRFVLWVVPSSLRMECCRHSEFGGVFLPGWCVLFFFLKGCTSLPPLFSGVFLLLPCSLRCSLAGGLFPLILVHAWLCQYLYLFSSTRLRPC